MYTGSIPVLASIFLASSARCGPAGHVTADRLSGHNQRGAESFTGSHGFADVEDTRLGGIGTTLTVA
ncbi:hypothetical protein DQW77_14565 [Roseovarius sp. TE539]|nr:hypothetical protein DQW77_14565 [Roseovarius sp. TE539]